MSVQHETEVTRTTERAEAAPELQYRAVSQDSLAMFLAAIGGAVLGMLLTLLVLALINGGTLSYAGERVAGIESHLQQVDENVGAVSANIDIVSEQAAALQQQLGAIDTALRNELETQGSDIEALSEAVTTLDQTRTQFNTFVDALAGALVEIGAVEAPAAAPSPVAGSAIVTETTSLTETVPLTETAPITEAVPITEATTLTESVDVTETATLTEEIAAEGSIAYTANPDETTTATTTANQVTVSPESPTNTITVLIFVDENGDGVHNEGEASLVGIPVTLQDSQGATLTTTESTETGVAFANLADGDYGVSVEETPGYSLTGSAAVTVAVAPDVTAGALVLMPVTAE